MGWDNLLESMSSELNRKQTVSKRKDPEARLFEQIAIEVTRDDEMDEAFGDTVKKAGKAVKRGWMKLKGKIKEVARWGFRLGVAVGKTLSGKFVLFNTSGTILTPEADKIGYEKMKGSGKKALTLEYNVVPLKGKNMKFYMDDKLSFGFGTGFDSTGGGLLYVIEPKNPGLREGIDYQNYQILDEADDKEKAAMAALADAEAAVFDSFTGPGADILSRSEDEMPSVAPVDVDYDDFQAELGSLMDMVKAGEVLKGAAPVKKLGIYAPTGWGKSQIIEGAAKKKDFFYFPLELQKVDINVIAGFPYLDEVSELENLPSDVKADRLSRAKKIVRIAPSQFLPPGGAPGNWLLFFDEFNRADTEKMAAVMNLLLTGELGGAAELVKKGDSETEELEKYKLPKKVVVVLAMNTATQTGVKSALNAVNDMDIATLERVPRILYGRYHVTSWLANFGNKPYLAELESGQELPLPTRIPPIITNFLIQVAKEKSGGKLDPDAQEAPFLLPIKVAQKRGARGGGGERTTSPRSWTVIADRMIEDGYQMFKTLDMKDVAERYGKRAERIKAQIKKTKPSAPDNNDQYLFAAWFQDGNNQEKLLAKQSPELGEEGVEYITRMIVSYRKKAREGVSIEEVLLNYKTVRPLFMKSFSNLGFGSQSQFLKNVVHALNGFKSEEDLINSMNERGVPIISKKGAAEQIFQTIKQIQKDLDMNADDFISFAHLVDAAKSDNELLAQIARKMAGKWDTYIKALDMKYKTKSEIEKELKQGKSSGKEAADEDEGEGSNEELANLFGKLGRL